MYVPRCVCSLTSVLRYFCITVTQKAFMLLLFYMWQNCEPYPYTEQHFIFVNGLEPKAHLIILTICNY